MANLLIEVLGRPAELFLIEDNSGDVLLTQEAFRAAGLRNNLAVAGDGEDALQRLRGQAADGAEPRPDLILLDLQLPRMNGMDLLRTIKGDPELCGIDVIALTSWKLAEPAIRSELKVRGVLVKPIDVEHLTTMVAAIEPFRIRRWNGDAH